MNKLTTEDYVNLLSDIIAKKYHLSFLEAKDIYKTSSSYKSFNMGPDFAQYQKTRDWDEIAEEAYEERCQGLYYA